MDKGLSERDFLLQTDWRASRIDRIGSEPWLTVYLSRAAEQENEGVYCALIPNDAVEKVLSRLDWDLSPGKGLPVCDMYHEGEKWTVRYCRFGDESGIEPLVVCRTFSGVRPSFPELSEEYRHFHNLYYDERDGTFIKIATDGTEDVVGRWSDDGIELRLQELRQFLAIKQMHLAVYFGIDRLSKIDPGDIGPDGDPIEVREDLLHYSFHTAPYKLSHNDEHRSSSRLFGKKLIAPVPKQYSGIWPYAAQERDYEEFVIGTDEMGCPIVHTCDPDKLAGYSGANPTAPYYLTPVFFRRQVLRKYYGDPDRYSVEDGYLRCGGLWGLPIDNDHPDYVVVYLGHLGRYLSHSEQLHWRSRNVSPEGRVSETHFRRSLLGQFADPQSPDLVFKQVFREFQREWRSQLGWPLFLPLSDADSHLLATLRILLTDGQAEFDAQVLALTKVLVDSINEKQLAVELRGKKVGEKGLSKLGRYLEELGMADTAQWVGFLRDLQDLRSTGVAHLKGSKYDKVSARFGIGEKSLKRVFSDILTQASALIRALSQVCPTSHPPSPGSTGAGSGITPVRY